MRQEGQQAEIRKVREMEQLRILDWRKIEEDGDNSG